MTEPYAAKSLAGDEVMILDRDDFAKLVGFDSKASLSISMQMSAQRLAILKALWWHGTIVDKSGFAIGTLTQRAQRVDPALVFTNVTQILASPAMSVCVERICHGKRTIRIELVALPQQWYDLIEKPDAHPEHPADSQLSEPVDLAFMVDPVKSPAITPAEPPPDPIVRSPEIEHELAGAVATALLARVVDIVNSAGSGSTAPFVAKLEHDVRDLEKRLGEQVGYVERLRRDLRSAQDEVIATKLERDGLRQKLAAAEYNLRVAVSPDAQRLIDAEVHRQVDLMMRQRPQSDKAS